MVGIPGIAICRDVFIPYFMGSDNMVFWEDTESVKKGCGMKFVERGYIMDFSYVNGEHVIALVNNVWLVDRIRVDEDLAESIKQEWGKMGINRSSLNPITGALRL